jgi:hypothetical protein
VKEGELVKHSDTKSGEVDASLISIAIDDDSGFIHIERKKNPISRQLTLNDMTFGNISEHPKKVSQSNSKCETSLNSSIEDTNGIEDASNIENIGDVGNALKLESPVEICQNEELKSASLQIPKPLDIHDDSRYNSTDNMHSRDADGMVPRPASSTAAPVILSTEDAYSISILNRLWSQANTDKSSGQGDGKIQMEDGLYGQERLLEEPS